MTTDQPARYTTVSDETSIPVIERRGANLHVRAGERFRLDAHVDIAPLRLVAIGAVISSTLLSIAAVVWASRARRDRERR